MRSDGGKPGGHSNAALTRSCEVPIPDGEGSPPERGEKALRARGADVRDDLVLLGAVEVGVVDAEDVDGSKSLSKVGGDDAAMTKVGEGRLRRELGPRDKKAKSASPIGRPRRENDQA